MPEFADTIAALATPVGTAALAVIRISGRDTKELARTLGGSPPPPRLARHRDYRDLQGELIDDVVYLFFAGPKSYTGEDALEISCHGNPYIAERILADLFARGCRPAEPGEFTQRAFLHGRLDLSQAEAVMDVIQARGARALAAAHHQLRGGLGQRLQGLIERLLEALARVEAYIDFPDEDLPPEDRGQVEREIDWLEAETNRLLATRREGQWLREGIRTILVGAPNVGKSSLLNRLVGSERALVSEEPGTTRDFIEEEVRLGGHCFRMMDTAGLNPLPAPLEKRGMEKTLERLVEADLVLYVVDAADPGAASPPAILSRLQPGTAIVVANKCDLAPGSPPLPFVPAGVPLVPVSARTGAGWVSFESALLACADGVQREGGAEKIAINARHAHALRTAREGLERARAGLMTNAGAELVASDLRTVLSALGEIVGRVDNERMLDRLFASFCIGK